jgi:hypothetical protein
MEQLAKEEEEDRKRQAASPYREFEDDTPIPHWRALPTYKPQPEVTNKPVRPSWLSDAEWSNYQRQQAEKQYVENL